MLGYFVGLFKEYKSNFLWEEIKCRLQFVDLMKVFSRGRLEKIKLGRHNYTKGFTTRGKQSLIRMKLINGNVI